IELKIARSQADHLLDARACLIRKREHGVVAPACWSLPIDSCQHVFDFFALQIVGRGSGGALLGNRYDALAVVETQRIVSANISKKHMQSGKADVACSGCVGTLCLQMVQKPEHQIRSESL